MGDDQERMESISKAFTKCLSEFEDRLSRLEKEFVSFANGQYRILQGSINKLEEEVARLREKAEPKFEAFKNPDCVLNVPAPEGMPEGKLVCKVQVDPPKNEDGGIVTLVRGERVFTRAEIAQIAHQYDEMYGEYPESKSEGEAFMDFFDECIREGR